MSITALEPVRGFKCPISFDTTENPVYLKGCEHFFDRAVIENWFRSKFANADAAPCPMCNRTYSIVKFLTEGREQAIARMFERILIVPLVTHEINRKLAKWENYNYQIVAREQHLEKQSQIIESQRQQIEVIKQEIDQLREVNKTQAVSIEGLKTDHEALKVKYKEKEHNLNKLKYNEKVSNYAMGIIGVVCIPATCIAPAVGAGMFVVTVLGCVAVKSANDSSSESTDLTVKKQQ